MASPTPYPIPVPSWVTNDETWHEYTSYGYEVSIPAAWAAFVMYFVLAIVHTVLTIKYTSRSWWLFIPTGTGIAEGLGYLFRVFSVEGKSPACAHPWAHAFTAPIVCRCARRPLSSAPAAFSLTTIILTVLLLLVPPIALAVVNYELLGRLMKASGAHVGCLRSASITRTFLALDILCFFVQCSSAQLLLSNDPVKIKEGSNIILGGLCLQFFVFSMFVVTALLVMRHPRLRNAPPNVQFALTLCLVTILLLLLRNGFRLYEYAQSYVHADDRLTKLVLNQEWEFYVFEFTPVYLVHLIFCIWNFGWILPGDAELAASLTPAGGQPVGTGEGSGAAVTTISAAVTAKSAALDLEGGHVGGADAPTRAAASEGSNTSVSPDLTLRTVS